jgi:hypothetical protein
VHAGPQAGRHSLGVAVAGGTGGVAAPFGAATGVWRRGAGTPVPLAVAAGRRGGCDSDHVPHGPHGAAGQCVRAAAAGAAEVRVGATGGGQMVVAATVVEAD